MYDAHVNKIFSSQFTIISNKQKNGVSYKILHDDKICLDFKFRELDKVLTVE